MQITRQADYAIRAVQYLSFIELKHQAEKPEIASVEPAKRNNDLKKRVATKDIAENKKIPPSFLAKIISSLCNAEILETSRGARGGVSLNRFPEDISLLDVVEAIDGSIKLNECVAESGNCNMEEDCPLKPIWIEAQAALVEKLEATKFDQLA
ncbi:RrF2 family transcriptional regulator [Chloroflexota bacterium]